MNRRKEKPVNSSGHLRYVWKKITHKFNGTNSTTHKSHARTMCWYICGVTVAAAAAQWCVPHDLIHVGTQQSELSQSVLIIFHATTIKFRKFFRKTASTESIFCTVYISVVSFTRSLESESMTAFVSKDTRYMCSEQKRLSGKAAYRYSLS